MTNKIINTRWAKIKDCSGIANVHEIAWINTYKGIIPHKTLNKMIEKRNTKWWESAVKQQTLVIVGEDKGDIVGYATFGNSRTPALKQQGEVYEIYIMPDYQGIGLGKKLFMKAREELSKKNMKGCVVWVLDENEIAKQFYRNGGGRNIAFGNETFEGKKLEKVAYIWN